MQAHSSHEALPREVDVGQPRGDESLCGVIRQAPTAQLAEDPLQLDGAVAQPMSVVEMLLTRAARAVPSCHMDITSPAPTRQPGRSTRERRLCAQNTLDKAQIKNQMASAQTASCSRTAKLSMNLITT